MAIALVNSKVDQSLVEYCVGEATSTCVYPGIMQCFAVAGNTQSKLLGLHVSPGFTEQDMKDAFGHLKALGGDAVMYWYIVGPFIDHFAVGKAQWRSVKDIKRTFTKAFGNKAATHMVLDASTERHEKRMYPNITQPMEISGLDIRVTVRGSTMGFEHREFSKNPAKPYRQLDIRKFKRI